MVERIKNIKILDSQHEPDFEYEKHDPIKSFIKEMNIMIQ